MGNRTNKVTFSTPNYDDKIICIVLCMFSRKLGGYESRNSFFYAKLMNLNSYLLF